MPTNGDTTTRPGDPETTGHVWDGIQEFNNPLPKWWLYVFYASIIWSIGYFVAYPAIPFINSHTGGVLGYTQREEIAATMEQVAASRSQYTDQIQSMDLSAVAEDQDLRNFSLAGGASTFGENCAPCHGSGGAGNPGYPTLADDDWIWGGSLEEIHTTIQYGIRSDHDETRFGEMSPFGDFLSAEEISDVAEYALSLSGSAGDEAAAARGEELFVDNCAACHGEDGTGMRELGAPNLADQIWLFGGTKEDVVAQVANPQHGVMPAWVDRLDPATIKMLAVYVHSLGGGE